jgi:hypothetical protein
MKTRLSKMKLQFFNSSFLSAQAIGVLVGGLTGKGVEEICHAVFKDYSSICLDTLSMRNLSG